MKCPKCNYKIHVREQVCRKCGYDLEAWNEKGLMKNRFKKLFNMKSGGWTVFICWMVFFVIVSLQIVATAFVDSFNPTGAPNRGIYSAAYFLWFPSFVIGFTIGIGNPLFLLAALINGIVQGLLLGHGTDYLLKSKKTAWAFYLLVGFLIVLAIVIGASIENAEHEKRTGANFNNLNEAMWHGTVERVEDELGKNYDKETLDRVFLRHVHSYCEQKGMSVESDYEARRKKFKLLLDAGADINGITKGYYDLPMSLAAGVQGGPDVDLVKLFLQYKPDLNKQGDIERTPLYNLEDAKRYYYTLDPLWPEIMKQAGIAENPLPANMYISDEGEKVSIMDFNVFESLPSDTIIKRLNEWPSVLALEEIVKKERDPGRVALASYILEKMEIERAEDMIKNKMKVLFSGEIEGLDLKAIEIMMDVLVSMGRQYSIARDGYGYPTFWEELSWRIKGKTKQETIDYLVAYSKKKAREMETAERLNQGLDPFEYE